MTSTLPLNISVSTARMSVPPPAAEPVDSRLRRAAKTVLHWLAEAGQLQAPPSARYDIWGG